MHDQPNLKNSIYMFILGMTLNVSTDFFPKKFNIKESVVFIILYVEMTSSLKSKIKRNVTLSVYCTTA
jgi:hypothetical protein